MINSMVFISYCVYTLFTAMMMLILTVKLHESKKRERKALMENKTLKTMVYEKVGSTITIQI